MFSMSMCVFDVCRKILWNTQMFSMSVCVFDVCRKVHLAV